MNVKKTVIVTIFIAVTLSIMFKALIDPRRIPGWNFYLIEWKVGTRLSFFGRVPELREILIAITTKLSSYYRKTRLIDDL